MIPILIFTALITLAYIYLINRLIRGWNKIPECYQGNTKPGIYVSVIIAFRNEENNLPFLITALKEQSCPKSEFEIIFADDHSDDRSATLVSEFIMSGGNGRLIGLESQDFGKKKALALAAAEAKGTLLIFTDADCHPPKNWIKSIVSYYEEEKPVLIAAPVIIQHSPGFFSKFQALEFFSLTGSTAGAFGIGDPVILNGANLSVQRDIYLESLSYLQNQASSGDDVFLLLHLKKTCPGKLVFLKSLDAAVSVSSQPGICAFLQQRFRWTSKSRFYRDRSIIFMAVIVLLINLWILNCLIMSFFSYSFILIGGAVFLAKTFIDYIFLRKVLFFFRKESLMKIFVLSQVIYFLYISFTGVAGNFIPVKWKGRAVK